jgi:hypothetical protein
VNKSDIEIAGEVAKGTAEGITAGMLKSFHELLTLVAGPACQELGEHFGDRVRAYRLKNAVRLLETVRDLHRKLGIPLQDVHPKLLFPILDCASLEDDPTLSALWAGLLAGAGTGQTLPAYVDLAKQLSPDDAKLLRSIYHASFAGRAEEHEFQTKDLYPGEVRNLFVRDVMNVPVDTPNTPEFWDRMPIACQNLLRLRLVTEKTEGIISLGILGYKFVQACEFRQA